MWATKERIFGFLVIVLFLGILFSPAKGYCVILTGEMLRTNGTDLEEALIFIYDFELAKSQGLQGTGANIGIVVDIGGSNFYDPVRKEIGISLNEKRFPLDKEYLLLFSTLKLQETENYPSFFYGASYNHPEDYSDPDTYVSSTRWWNVETLPRIKFTSGTTLDLGKVTAPRTVRLRGKIKDENGDYLPDVGVELYYDSNGVPTQIPFPFTRFVRTNAELDSQGFNFAIHGVLTKPTSYYVKLIPNNKGYIDTFIMDEIDANKPRKINFTSNYDIPGEYRLTKKGAKIWGYIRRDEDSQPVTNAMISIQGLSDNEDEPYPVFYVHDPNYARYNDLTDAEKYLNRVEPYYYYYRSDGKYEINGLPYEDHNYYLSAIELQGEDPKIYATPLWYDGNDGAFDVNKAKKISLDKPGEPKNSVRVDFYLNDGACINGGITLDEVPSDAARAIIVDDPNFFNEDNISLIIEAFKVNSDGTLSQLALGGIKKEGTGPYSVCGLPPEDYIIRSYGLNGFYPPEFYDDQTTYFTGEIISLDYGDSKTDKDIGLALGGMVEGRVTDSDGKAIKDASVLVNQVNLGNPLVGYFFINSEGAFLAQYSRKTDSDGRFYFWGLPAGLYTIFVNGVLEDEDTGYLPQFYAVDPPPTMIANQTSPMSIADNDPDFMTLNDFQLIKSGTGPGGIISGNVSLSLSDPSLVKLSSTACFIRLFKADTGIEISNPLYKFDDPDGNVLPYQVMVPEDGDYFLSFQDTDLDLLPHFYSEGGATVNRNEASPLTISRTATLLKNKNIVLSEESGRVSGEVQDFSNPNKGISGMIVYASQEINEGSEQGTWRSVRQAETKSNGEFTLKGLYKGTYIFSVTDPYSLYAARYYTETEGDPYIPDNAYTWTYDPNIQDVPYLTFRVKEGGKISGSVGSQFSGTKVYAYRIIDENPVAGFSDTADPNYSITGLIPGEYILGFKDPNLNYVPEYYSQSGFTTDFDLDNPSYITVEIDKTTWVPEMNFTQLGATVEGQITQETDTNPQPMLNTYIFLYRLSEKRELWATTPAQFTATDSDGKYSLKGLLKGNYKIIAFGPQYRPVSSYITIAESDLGFVKVVDLTFPVGWSGMDKKKDKVLTLEQGLNLIAYPTRIPPYVTGYTSLSFLKDIVMVNGRGALTLKTFSPYDQKWKSASFGNTELEGVQVTDVHGSNYSISNGQGFLLYSEEGPTINFNYFPGQTSLWLKKGNNLVGNVAFNTDMADIDETDFAPDADFTTRKMLTKMGEDASVSIQTFEAREGKWQATYWMWGKSAGKDTKVKDELGYIVTMKEDVNNWYPANNN